MSDKFNVLKQQYEYEKNNKNKTYDVMSSCNKCGGKNSIAYKDSISNQTCEAETKCTNCGHLDYWAYGFFESRSDGFSKCEKY